MGPRERENEMTNRPGSSGSFRMGSTVLLSALLLCTCLTVMMAPPGSGGPGTAARTVNGEKGSLHEIDLDGGELTDLMMNDDDQLELAEETYEITEEFETLDGAERSENLVEVHGASEVEHIFRRSYGGSGSEYVESSIVTSDSGYVVAGSVYSTSTLYDVFITKIDGNGDHLWTRTFGGRERDYGYDVLETTGGDLVIVGGTASFGTGDNDVWLIRTDSSGIERWNRTYDFDGSEFGLAVTETTGGDFAICGQYQRGQSVDMLLFMVSRTGTETWNVTWGDDTNQLARDVIQISDGNLILIGDTEPFNGMEVMSIWKYDTSGEEIWNMTYTSTAMRSWTYGYNVAELSGGDLMLFGLMESTPGMGQKFLLVRSVSQGKPLWTQTYTGGTGNTRAYSMTVNQTGVTMVGTAIGTTGTTEDAYVLRTDLSGNKKWDFLFGGAQLDAAAEAVPHPDGMCIFGHSMSWGPGAQGVFRLDLNHDGGASRGLYRSGDMMDGSLASGLKEIGYTADIPTGSSVELRVSLDGVSWFDASGHPGKYTTLSSGTGRVLLSNLPGLTGEFRFELTFQCQGGNTAKMDSLTLRYLAKHSDGQFVSYPFDGGEGARWGMIGFDWGGPEATFVTVRTRTGDTIEELTSKPFTGPDGTEITSYVDRTRINPSEGGGKLLQIHVNLSTEVPHASPLFSGLNFTYDRPGSIGEADLAFDVGDIDDNFRFSVVFTDPDDDPPDSVMVEIDGENHTMDPADDDDSMTLDGKEYEYYSGFSAGNHTYRFFAGYGDSVLSTGGDHFNVLPGPLSSLAIEPEEITVTADGHAQFSATGRDRMGNIVEVLPEWEIEGGGTIDGTGNFTANVVGTWIVKATSGQIYAYANVTVEPGSLVGIEVITESYTFSTDDMVQLQARGSDSDDNTIEIEPTWEVDGGGSIDQTGLFDPQRPGFWTVYANLSGISGSETIEVVSGALSYIIVEPDDARLNISDTRKFSAGGFDSDGNQVFLDPRWEVDGGGSMHSSGIFTAETPGTWTVTCSYEGIVASVSVIVNAPPSADDDDDFDDDDGGAASEKEGISPALVGILIGAIVLLLIGVVVVLILVRRRKKGPEPMETPIPSPDGPPPAEAPHTYEDPYGGYTSGESVEVEQTAYGYPSSQGSPYDPGTDEAREAPGTGWPDPAAKAPLPGEEGLQVGSTEEKANPPGVLEYQQETHAGMDPAAAPDEWSTGNL
ncbi:MAG: hypothetical protein ACMUHY_05655 [Thermoplasmatota archaeon]